MSEYREALAAALKGTNLVPLEEADDWADTLTRRMLPRFADSLDAAWADAEAAADALGWILHSVVHLDPALSETGSEWRAKAGTKQAVRIVVDGPTPSAALRVLAAKIKGMR
jgi:hypothetical protein